MGAYRRVYDSRHLQADCKKTGISSRTLRSVIEYGLPLPFYTVQNLKQQEAPLPQTDRATRYVEILSTAAQL